MSHDFSNVTILRNCYEIIFIYIVKLLLLNINFALIYLRSMLSYFLITSK